MPNYELGALAQPCWPLINEEVAGNNTSWEVYPNPAQAAIYIQHKDGKQNACTIPSGNYCWKPIPLCSM
jgi:hypothetical protein